MLTKLRMLGILRFLGIFGTLGILEILGMWIPLKSFRLSGKGCYSAVVVFKKNRQT